MLLLLAALALLSASNGGGSVSAEIGTDADAKGAGGRGRTTKESSPSGGGGSVGPRGGRAAARRRTKGGGKGLGSVDDGNVDDDDDWGTGSSSDVGDGDGKTRVEESFSGANAAADSDADRASGDGGGGSSPSFDEDEDEDELSQWPVFLSATMAMRLRPVGSVLSFDQEMAFGSSVRAFLDKVFGGQETYDVSVVSVAVVRQNMVTAPARSVRDGAPARSDDDDPARSAVASDVLELEVVVAAQYVRANSKKPLSAEDFGRLLVRVFEKFESHLVEFVRDGEKEPGGGGPPGPLATLEGVTAEAFGSDGTEGSGYLTPMAIVAIIVLALILVSLVVAGILHFDR